MSDTPPIKDESPETALPAAGAGDGAAAEAASPIEVLEKEKAELRERMLRIAAEFENFKKRSRKDVTEALIKGKEQVLRDMLDVSDNLDRAAASAGDSPDAGAIRDGVNLVLRMFHSKLERHEVRPFEAKGKPFDPRLHEAISRQMTATVPPGHVAEELARGYMMGDRLLRAASVVVSVAVPSATPPVAEAPADQAPATEAPPAPDSQE